MKRTPAACLALAALLPLSALAEPASTPAPDSAPAEPSAAPAPAEPPPAPPPPSRPPPPRSSTTTTQTTMTPGHRVSDGPARRYRSHKPGLRVDAGFANTSDTAMWGLGFGYMYALGVEFRPFGGDAEAVARVGAGPDLTMSVDADGFHGISGFMSLRLTAVANRVGGFGLEAGVGSGVGRGGIAPAGRLGIYLSGRYFELGYFYQAALINRPEWVRPHNLGIRLHVPIFSE
jgi:hypothetical protein